MLTLGAKDIKVTAQVLSPGPCHYKFVEMLILAGYAL